MTLVNVPRSSYSQPDQRVTFRLLFGLYSWLFFPTRSPSTASAEIHICVYFPRAISRRFSAVLVSPTTTKGRQFEPSFHRSAAWPFSIALRGLTMIVRAPASGLKKAVVQACLLLLTASEGRALLPD